MAVIGNTSTVSLTGDSFDFLREGAYTITVASATKVQVKVDGGQNTNIAAAAFLGVDVFDVTGVTKLNLNGIAIKEADAVGGLEPGVEVNELIFALLQKNGVQGTMDLLTVNGGKADAFALVWDFLDDGYSYYDTARAKAFVQLGATYVGYLEAGGDPLLDVTAKFKPDDNGNDVPQRDQSLHDNLLGNLDSASIIDRFFDGNASNNPGGTIYTGSASDPDEVAGQDLLDLVAQLGFDTRPYFGGYEGEANAAHLWEMAHFADWFA